MKTRAVTEARAKMLSLFKMAGEGGSSTSTFQATQVSPPASGGPPGGGKSQAGKAEINNPNQYGKPPTLGPRKGNMKTPKFEDIVGAIKNVAEGGDSTSAALDLLFDDEDGEEDEDAEEGSQAAAADEKKKDSMEPGGGGRFNKLSKKLGKKGVKDPDALAAVIGRKKFGKKKFGKMASQGDSVDQKAANVAEGDLPAGNATVATASGAGVGKAPTPAMGGPAKGDLVFNASAPADATAMGSEAEQLRAYLKAAQAHKKIWAGGLYIHKQGQNEFELPNTIATSMVSLEAAVQACLKFGDIKLAPAGAPKDKLT